MRQIHYAGEDLITGTEIANALLTYAHALAENDASDTVEIPVVGPEGGVVSSSFLIGPASQLVAVDVPEFDGDEVVDEDVVQRLLALTRKLVHPSTAQALDDAPLGGINEYD